MSNTPRADEFEIHAGKLGCKERAIFMPKIRELEADKERLELLMDLDVRIPDPKTKSGWYHFNCRSDIDAKRAALEGAKP